MTPWEHCVFFEEFLTFLTTWFQLSVLRSAEFREH